MSALDIHAIDRGYSVALHLLVLLEHAGMDGLSAAELGQELQTGGARTGAWLRDLRCRGLVAATRVSPGSTRVRWAITDAGRLYLGGS